MAHTLDTSARITGSTSPLTAAYTCGAGTTVLILAIVVGGSTNRAGGAPTYNGVAFTQAGTIQKAASAPETGTEIWYLLDPTVGSSQTISIPNTGSLSLFVRAVSAKAGSGLVSIFDVAGGGNGTSTNPSATVSVADGAFVCACVGSGAATWAPSGRSGTLLSDNDDGAFGDGSQYAIKVGAGNQVMSWTFGTSEDWAISIVSLREATLTTKTNTSVGRIQKTIDQTRTSIGRIQKTIDQTLASVGRIQKTIDSVLTSVARLQKIIDSTLLSVGRIQVTTEQTIPSIGRVQKTIDQTLTSVAQIETSTTVDQYMTSVSRIQKTIDNTLTSIARVQKEIDQTNESVGRLQKTEDQIITAISRIQKTFDESITSTGRMQVMVDQEMTSITRIQAFTTKTITSRARIGVAAISTKRQGIGIRVGIGI